MYKYVYPINVEANRVHCLHELSVFLHQSNDDRRFSFNLHHKLWVIMISTCRIKIFIKPISNIFQDTARTGMEIIYSV
jgi:hypothetical protein